MLLAAASLCGCSSEAVWKRQVFAFSLPPDPPNANTQTNILVFNRVAISPVFQSRSFTYRTGENTYEHDPYAGFLVPPERALGESIRAWLRESGGFGRVIGPDSGLSPTTVAEVSVNELYGDFRKGTQPVGAMSIHFIFYEIKEETPGPVLLDRVYSRETPLAQKTPEALMAAWDADLREIMRKVSSEYAKENANNH
jgi:hypothetical protein